MTAGLIDIVYEDDFLLVLAKPAGISTQAPPGIDSLEVRAKYTLKQRDHSREEIYLGVPHRLDRPTSGIVLFTKMKRAARKVSKQFERRTVRKIYWAWLQGSLDRSQGEWVDQVRKIPDLPQGEVTAADHPESRRAALSFRKLAEVADATLLEIELQTGRFHQIRLQAAHRGHPIVGDKLYGSTSTFDSASENDDPRQAAIALHARSLSIAHPQTKEEMTFTAPLPSAWQAWHRQHGLESSGIGENRNPGGASTLG